MRILMKAVTVEMLLLSTMKQNFFYLSFLVWTLKQWSIFEEWIINSEIINKILFSY